MPSAYYHRPFFVRASVPTIDADVSPDHYHIIISAGRGGVEGGHRLYEPEQDARGHRCGDGEELKCGHLSTTQKHGLKKNDDALFQQLPQRPFNRVNQRFHWCQ